MSPSRPRRGLHTQLTGPSRPAWQVRVLKEKIEAEKGKEAFPVSGQKLIYAGKILSDDVAIKEYKIDEKNFVVVMVTKVRPGPAPTCGWAAGPEVGAAPGWDAAEGRQHQDGLAFHTHSVGGALPSPLTLTPEWH